MYPYHDCFIPPPYPLPPNILPEWSSDARPIEKRKGGINRGRIYDDDNKKDRKKYNGENDDDLMDTDSGKDGNDNKEEEERN